MRVIQLADYGGAYPGSFIPMLIKLGQASIHEGWQYEVVFSQVACERPWLKLLENEGIKYSFAPTGPFLYRLGWLKRLVRESRDVTVLHTHFSTFDKLAAAIAALDPKVQAVWHAHSDWPITGVARLKRILKHRVLAVPVRAILAVGPGVEQALLRELAPRHKVHLCLNGIDTASFAVKNRSSRDRIRASLGIDEQVTVLLHFGWAWETKGGDIFLDALRDCNAKSSKKLLGISVGGGEIAEKLIIENGLSSVARVIEPLEHVQELYAASDIFVAPSRNEAFSFSVVEALVSGLPVIASDVGGHRVIRTRVKSMSLVPPTPEAFSAEIIRIVEMADSQKAELTRSASSAAMAAFDISIWVESVSKIYKQLGRDLPGKTIT